MAGESGATRTAVKSVGRRLAATTAIAVCIAVSTPSAPFVNPAHAQGFSFSNVTIEGNERVDAATILSFLGIAQGEALTAGQLNDAVQRLTNAGLFETVEVVPQGSTLLVRVQEYPVINVISFEGNRRLDDEELAEAVASESRRVFSPAQVEADAAALTEIYRVTGRMAATVTPKVIRRDDNRVDLVFEITEGRVVEVERLAFVGNRAFSDRRLRQVLETKQAGLLRTVVQADTFVAERLELDKQLLRDFYLSRGYVDFQVIDASAEVTPERDATFVTFSVREGRPFKIGAVTTVSEIEGVDAAAYDEVVRLRSGVTYSPALIENNIARMEAVALRQGLNFVTIEPRITRNDRNQTLDVTFALVRGEKVFVERIDIEGNTTTLDQVIRRQFRTVEGDPLNPREVRRAAERIRALGFFANAAVEAEPGSGPDQVVVNVDVEEQPTGSLSFGVSYGANSGVAFNVGLSETNFLGRGQGLAVNISTGSTNLNSSLRFTEPAFLGRDLRFGVGAYYRTTDQDNARYDTRNIGFDTSLSFPVGELSRLELRYRISEDRISDIAAGSSDILVREAARDALITSAIGYTYSFDNRVEGINPRGGILFRFSQDFAGLGGDTKYVSTTALAVAEQRVLNEEVTLRAVFEGGVINSLGGNSTRVTERFFANGKIRGFEPNGIGPRDLGASNEDALGGNAFATMRFEADFPLGLPEEYGISGGAFLDVGSVWSLDDTAGTGGPVDDGSSMRAAIGVSVFWNTPIGPLRFNFAKPLKKEDYDIEQAFDLTISTQF
ncbi:MAG: outer membrane protein assembly factor BamA [Rhodobacteraceae bacterium]|jgi:outer membrane protein insertion porin family|nr:outer membrane protein assembly factor BamA [Paracoccaceae bacterium]